MSGTLLDPVVGATRETFARMLELDVDVTEAHSLGIPPVHEVSAVIGLVGAGASGAVVLSTDRATATALVSRLAGQRFEAFDEQVADGLGELANIVAGAAKGAIKGGLALSLPMVVAGSAHQVFRTRDVKNELAFVSCALGPLCVQVHLKESSA